MHIVSLKILWALLRGMAARHISFDDNINVEWRNPIVTIRVSYFHDILCVSDCDAAMVKISACFRSVKIPRFPSS